jgi:methylmalonyl-CoA mutase
MSSKAAKTDSTSLLAEFNTPSYADWQKLVEAELKGAPFDKKMFTATPEGITLRPIYRAEDTNALPHVNSFPGFAPFVRGTRATGYITEPWAVAQEISAASPQDFNALALGSIARGLNALNIVVDRATRNGYDPDFAPASEVGTAGLSIASLADLERALNGVDLEKTFLFVRTGASALPFAALLAALCRKRKQAVSVLRGCIEMDPLGVLAHEGKLPQSLVTAYREMAALTRWTSINAPKLQTICVHSRAWHDAGGNAVEELAFTLATALEYFRELDKHGLEVNTVAPQMRLAVNVGSNFFMEIAKLRALRMLWSKLVSSLGGNEASQKAVLHVRTALWNKTKVDPYNNILRTSIEAFAGALGGADSMQVGAFDEVVRTPDDFSLRLARNTQLILQRECMLTEVIDPAGGSWYVESITGQLAQKAWTLFQEVEKLGGMTAALRAGFPQKKVAASAADKIKAVAYRRTNIVGVNQYANAAEKPLAVEPVDVQAFAKRRAQEIASYRTSLGDEDNAAVMNQLARLVEVDEPELFAVAIAAAKHGATSGEITRSMRIRDGAPEVITPVCLTRASAVFEGLRMAMSRQPKPAKVFLCNMGPLKEHKGRADFSRGFFGAGGFEVASPAGFKTPADAVAAFAKSGAKVAVICSTDENYPALVPVLTPELKAAVPGAIVVLAGYPTEQIEAHKKSGVDEFIHIRSDAAETLRTIQTKLGIL